MLLLRLCAAVGCLSAAGVTVVCDCSCDVFARSFDWLSVRLLVCLGVPVCPLFESVLFACFIGVAGGAVLVWL